MATVNIRIVGIYMNESVDLELTPNTTVKDVMDAYRSNNPVGQPRGLNFQDATPRGINPSSGALSPTSFTYNVPNDPSVLNTKGGRTIMPGQYTLTEPSNFQNPRFNAFQAFQYYVLEDVNGGTVNKSKGGGFTYYNQTTSNYDIEDGNTIVWRQVSIKLQPDFRVPIHEICKLMHDLKIRFDLLVNAGTLDLHGYRLAGRQNGAVNLCERGGSLRFVIEVDERVFEALAGLTLDNGLGRLNWERRHLILELLHLPNDVQWENVFAVAENLSELDEGRPELNERQTEALAKALANETTRPRASRGYAPHSATQHWPVAYEFSEAIFCQNREYL